MRKTISLILSVLMILSSFSVITTISAKETNVVPTGATYSGTTGDCTWSFDESTGTLTISGNGEMDGNVSWCDYLSVIKTVVIEDGVTTIGDFAFFSCSSLKSVTIPDGVISIGDRAFEACSSLTSIDVGVENKYFSSVDGNLYNKAKTEFIQYAIGKNQNDFVIPNSVTNIIGYAFCGCSSLTSITIPDGVTYIGYKAFYDCSSLTGITIPDSVTSIGNYAFEWCSGLTSITIPDSVTSINNSAFGDCSSLTSITIPDSVTSIGYEAFRGCSSLTSVTIPDSVTSIDYEAFRGCSSLTSITIPDSVTSIGIDAFYGTAYYNDKNNWDNGLLYINNYLIKAKYDIENCSIKDGTKLIADSTFEGCSSLTSVTIPDSVMNISTSAFAGCSSLTSITIPDSVTSIGEGVFLHCSNLISITIPDSVTLISASAFGDCSSLTSIIIPDSVTSIGGYAFGGCSSLTSIIIPDSVTSIDGYAFDGCSSLTSITIPDSVTSISNSAFYGTAYYNDENNWDNGLLYLNNYLIEAKYDIEKCVVKDGTKVIAGGAFENCSSLKNVYYIGSEEQWKSIKIEDYNDELLNANITYNYVPTEPTTSSTEPTTVTESTTVSTTEPSTSTVTETEPTTVSTTEPSTTITTIPSTVPTTTQPTTTKPTVKKVAKVSLRKKSVVLVKGRSTTVKATVTPTNATNKKLKWTTSNSKVAVVNSQGKITAKGRGNATIKVMALDGSNKYATVKVTVKQPVTSVKLNRNSAILKVKGKAKQKTVTLKATAYPKNANNKAVSWKSSNIRIATVNSKGKVTAKKKGTCYITATAKDGSKKSAKCKIVVK